MYKRQADGYVDGVKDGYITLDEIVKYATWKTRRVGGHTPVTTGTYNKHVVMNRVPPREFIEAFDNSTEGMTEAEVAELVHRLDGATRL